MVKRLYLPDHVVAKVNEARKAATIEPAYVKPEERVLDPSLIDKPLMDRLPQPTGWRILVMPYKGKEQTDGGLFLPDEFVDREAIATVVAYVLRVGPEAYKDERKFGQGAAPWCKQGDWICIGRYTGSRFKIDGGEVRIINDDEVIATLLEPDDIKHV